MTFFTIWLPAILVFILILGLLIFFHELGHFLAARWAGVGVKEFAFGFPPRVWGRKIGKTLYLINLIPIGGYVKLEGEDSESEKEDSFSRKPICKRMIIIVAGVMMNFVLAFLVFLVLFWCSYPSLIQSPERYGGKWIEGSGGLFVEGIEKDSLADSSDIRIKDFIYMVGDIESPGIIDLRSEVKENQGGELVLKLKRGDESIEKKIEIGESELLGVGITEKIGRVSYTWWKAPYYAFVETVGAIGVVFMAIINFFKDLIVTRQVSGDIVGPVGIFNITSIAVQLGFAYVLGLLISLTVTLGIINILPFPALDGGRLALLAVEKLRGKKMKQSVENVINAIGFYLLIALIILVTVRDIVRL